MRASALTVEMRTLRTAELAAVGLGLCLLAVLGCGEAADPGHDASPIAESSATELATVSGTAPAPVGSFPAVVILDSGTVRRSAGAHERPNVFMDQYGTAFLPPVLLARTGQTVEFANSEEQMHNVHVVVKKSGETVFNVATPQFGEPFRHAFDEPGVYAVSCGIHQGMAAFVIVVEGPWAEVAAENGSFSIPDVKTGQRYTVRVWRAEEGIAEVSTVEVTGDLELDLRRSV